MNEKVLNEIDSILKKNGFKRKRNKVWYIENGWFLFVFEIQLSRFSDIFFINYGAYFFELNESKFDYKSDSIHLCARLDPYNNNLLSENADDLEIVNYIQGILNSKIYPLFNKITNPDEGFINSILSFKEVSPQNTMPANIIAVIRAHIGQVK